MRWRLVLHIVGLGYVLMGSPAAAQMQTGEIFGRVSDKTGAVLPGTTVTIESPALIAPQSAVASATGGYRFPSLPIGTYKVTFELPGFGRLVREGIRLETGFNAEINGVLDVSAVEETVTVSGESPVVDTKTTLTGATFTRETLDTIPSARDPWVILEQTPGMVMDRQNVGGNQSGQQSGFLAHGSSANQNWNLNGGTVTDMAANSSPGYYDFDAFEEMQIQTGGGDASTEAAGVSINLITKSGSNRFRGSTKFVFVNDALQGDNITDDLRRQGAGSGNPIKDIKEYGFEVGGPIVRDRAWFWGGYSGNDIVVSQIGFLKPGCTDANDPACLMDDKTYLDNYNAKVDYQWSRDHRSNVYYNFGNKTRNSRGASALRPLETTVVQSNPPGGQWQASHQWVVSDRLAVDGKYTHGDSSFLLDFQEPALATVQPSFDIATSMNGRSTTREDYWRPTDEFKGEANYYLPGWLGGDHSVKIGGRYRHTPYRSRLTTGGGATARFNNSVPAEANITRNSDIYRDMWSYSLWLHDTFRLNRWTFNFGLRWDYQDDKARAAEVAANQVLPDLLPALAFEGADSGVAYSTPGPRIGVNYDLFGTGKSVAKFNTARYYGVGIYTATTMSPTGQTTLRYPWADLNGDRFVQRNELDLTRLLTFSSNYDPANPSSVRSAATVDPNLENDITDEIIVGFDHELMPNFGVGVSYIWRHYHNGTWSPRVGLKSADYVPVTFSAACGNPTCDQPTYTATYWQLPFTIPAASVLTNSAYVRSYQGVEFTARKRFTNKWMVMGALTWNDTKANYTGPDQDFQEPTNIAQQDGKQVGTLNVRWVAKLSGMYELPWGFSTGAFLNMRQGFPLYPSIQSPTRTGGLGRVDVYVYDVATKRYPNFTDIDWRMDKRINLGGSRRIEATATIFNLLNANTVLARVERQNASNANNVTTILAPRVVNLQVRFLF